MLAKSISAQLFPYSLTRYFTNVSIKGNSSNVDSILQNLNHQQLEIGTNRNSQTFFQRQSDSLSNYSLFSAINTNDKIKLISNKCNDNKEIDRSIGCIYGMAIGDAIGAPLEFTDATKSIIYSSSSMDSLGSYTPYFDINNGLYYNELNQAELKRGQWTDDCSMGLCMADSLIVNQTYNGSDIRKRFWNWWFNGYNCSNSFAFGLGGNISKSLYSLKYNEIPSDIYENDSPDSGNGSIMRLAPIPIFYSHSNIDTMLYYVGQSSLTTHPGIIAKECCKLMSYIIVKGIHNNLDENIQQFLERITNEYKSCLMEGNDDNENEKHAKSLIVKLIDSNESDQSTERNWNWKNKYGDIGIDIAMKNRGEIYNGYPNLSYYFGSYCLDGLAIGLHSVYHSKSIGGAIVNAVNLLGDCDSTGSIAGQIAGSYYGFNSSFGDNNNYNPNEKYMFQNVTEWDNYDIGLRGLLLCELGKHI